MKNILKYLLLCCSALSLFGCEDYLDKTPQGDKTKEDVFTRFNETEQLINRLYFYVRAADQPLVHIRYFSDSALADECEGSSAENGWSNKFNEGDWEPGAELYSKCNATTDAGACHTFWPALYQDIRCANVILEGIEKYNTPDSQVHPGTLSQRIGEVYFLRAYLHYCVLKSYGECPYVDYTVDPNNLPKFERENVHSIVEKICNDCDNAFSRVPERYLAEQFGRVEKGTCLALKAMARWIAATPLYNGSTLKGDNRNYASEYQRYDPARWDAAAAAAKAVIDFTTNTGEKRYSLYQGADKSNTTNFGNVDESNGKVYTRLWELFSGTARSLDAKKCEWIWFFLQAKTVGYHNDMYPPSSQGQAREVPVQEHVDEYEVIGPDGYGYPIYALKENHKALYGGLISEEDMAKAYDDANPYENRDPRFYRDITYHGAMFKGKWINTATGSDEINAANSTTTGYFTHKFFDGYYTKGMSGDWNMDAPLIRLATIYLVYAEAVTRSKGATDEVYNMMNDLRARSFMAPIPPAAKTNKELLLDYILRERRVELYHEKSRFFSTRFYLEPTSPTELAKESQWNALPGSNDEKAQQYFAKYGAYPKTQHRICGMRPVEDPDGKISVGGKKYRMERFWKEDRVFLEKHYLFPIPTEELQRANIQQNPNW